MPLPDEMSIKINLVVDVAPTVVVLAPAALGGGLQVHVAVLAVEARHGSICSLRMVVGSYLRVVLDCCPGRLYEILCGFRKLKGEKILEST